MECEAFAELKKSKIVDIRSGCIALITRAGVGGCIENSGAALKFCPYCGNKILSEYDKENGYWDWWHE